MDKTVSYLEYLVNGINKADGLNDSIDVIIEGKDKLRSAQTNQELAQKDTDELKNKIPEDLVDFLKSKMNSKSEKSTQNVAEALENAIKTRIAEGRNISHAIINGDGYEIYEEKNSSKNDDELDR